MADQSSPKPPIINVDEAVKLVRSEQPIENRTIPNLRELLERLSVEKDTAKLLVRFKGCTIEKCDCSGLEVTNPFEFRQYNNEKSPCTFTAEADFTEAHFTAVANFFSAHFAEGANFFKAKFMAGANFSKAKFDGGEVSFTLVHFMAWADFSEAHFTAVAGFWAAHFMGDAFFMKAQFSVNAYFSNAKFTAVAGFWKAKFDAGADFERAHFKTKADFQDAYFTANANFFEILLGGDLDLRNAVFTRTSSGEPGPLNLSELRRNPGAVIRLTMDQIGRTQRRKWRPTLPLIFGEESDDSEKLRKAAAQYNLLRDNFREIPSTDEEEDRCHYKYKDLTRRAKSHQFRKGRFGAWVWDQFTVFGDWFVLKWCLGYGIYTKRPLFTALGVILVFAGIYTCFAGPNTISYLPDANQQNPANWPDSGFNPLYFSVITFTTIGYGDYAPIGFWMRLFAGTEGLLGLILMALFTVTYARKLIR